MPRMDRSKDFKIWLRKRVRFIDFIIYSGKMELTPEWFADRYGSPTVHGISLLKNLWLFLGFLAVVGLLLGSEVRVRGVPSHSPIKNYGSKEFDSGTAGRQWLFTSNELRECGSSDFYQYPESWINPQHRYYKNPPEPKRTKLAQLVREQESRSFSKQSSNYEWRQLSPRSVGQRSFGNPIELSLVHPVFPDSAHMHEDSSVVELREVVTFYPLDHHQVWSDFHLESLTPDMVQIVEIVNPVMKLQKVEDEIEEYSFSEKTVFYVEEGVYPFVCPGYLSGEVQRVQGDSLAKDWKIRNVRADVYLERRVPLPWATLGLEGSRGSFFDDQGVRYFEKIESYSEEFDRLMQLRLPSKTVVKITSVAFTIGVPLLLAPILSILVVLIGQRDDERPFTEILSITSHLTMGSSFLLICTAAVVEPLSNSSYENRWILLLIGTLVPCLFFMWFCVNRLPLQLTACCGYPVAWSAKSWAFGLRKSCSLPSLLFRFLGVILASMYFILAYASETFVSQLQYMWLN